MFVRKSKYEELASNAEHLVSLCNSLIKQKFLLINEVEKARAENSQFSQKEIKTLIRLCHPDKHGGSESSKHITQKLLELRQ